ncbi:MAG: hypothetical protein FWG54_04815 [Bacteroidetes bacterium]|nr:hypothetical protein [Bacteroidota bacterium]
MRFVYAILCVLIDLLPLRAQHDLRFSLFSTPVLSASDSNKVTIRADIVGFFKNNEYFSPVAVGQTLPGTASTFALGYQRADRFKAELGASFVKYSGRDPLHNAVPFVRLQYSITPALHMVLGNLYGGINHRLIEPLYLWEQHFTAKPESGLQCLFHTDRWFADAWVDWQHFIRYGDPEQEALTFGASLAGRLTNDGSRVSLTMPLQLLMHHKGGQIDASGEHTTLLANTAMGLCTRLNINSEWVRTVGLDLYAVGYWGQYSKEPFEPYDKGWGVYPVFSVDASPIVFMAGYWYAQKYYAFAGEPLFGSFNPCYPDQLLPERNLVTCKLVFDKELLTGVFMGAQFESYSDLHRGKTDYSFGIHLRFNHLFRFTK